MKNILFVIPSMHPAGGIERVVSTLVNKLSAHYHCSALTFDSREYFYEVNNNVDRFTLECNTELNMQKRWKRMFQVAFNSVITIRKLRLFFKGHNFDYIYVTHPLIHLMLLLAGIPSNKIVISEHGANNNYNKFYRFIRNITYKKCHAYCLPTKTDYRFYEKMNFPVRYTPHYRPELNYAMHAEENKTVLCVGRLTPDKQHLLLLGMWRDILEFIPKGWVLNIVGSGELEPNIKEFIRDNKLEDFVKLSGAVKKIEEIYCDSSIFVLTSRSEGFGMVLLEAISFGLPTISFNCPSGPMDIINEKNGFLIPDGDCLLFKSKLIELINSESLRHQLSISAYESANDWQDTEITKYWQAIFK